MSLLTSGTSPRKEVEALCSHDLLQTSSLINVADLCSNHLDNSKKTFENKPPTDPLAHPQQQLGWCLESAEVYCIINANRVTFDVD